MNLDVFIDGSELDEDAQVAFVGEAVMTHRTTVIFTVKRRSRAHHYIRKLKNKYPALVRFRITRDAVDRHFDIEVLPPDEN